MSDGDARNGDAGMRGREDAGCVMRDAGMRDANMWGTGMRGCGVWLMDDRMARLSVVENRGPPESAFWGCGGPMSGFSLH